MTSTSGDVYVLSLISCLDRKNSEVLSATRLQSLRELQALRTSNPVEYLRGCAADLQDYKRLERLQHLLQCIKSLSVVSLTPNKRDPTCVNLSPFKLLTSLELRSCDLSTAAWIGVEGVLPTLQAVKCYDSLEQLQHLLAPSSQPSADPNNGYAAHPQWPCLTSLTCSSNSFAVMDASLTLLPAVQVLDLRSNNIATVSNLHACHSLTLLNLSHNCITSPTPLYHNAATLRQVFLQGNCLSSTEGLEALLHVRELDLRDNLIAGLAEVERIAGLPELVTLHLKGNPLAFARRYRMRVLSCFADPEEICLDGIPASRAELGQCQGRRRGRVHITGASLQRHEDEVLGWFVDQPHHLASLKLAHGLPSLGRMPSRSPSSGSGSSGPVRRQSSSSASLAQTGASAHPARRVLFSEAAEGRVDRAASESLLQRATSSGSGMSLYSSDIPVWLREARMSRWAGSDRHIARSHSVQSSPSSRWQSGELPTPHEKAESSGASSPPRYGSQVLQRLHAVSPPAYQLPTLGPALTRTSTAVTDTVSIIKEEYASTEVSSGTSSPFRSPCSSIL